MTTITVCTTCRQPHLREAKEGAPCGEAMLAAVEAAAEGREGVTVRGAACLMGCGHGCNIAVSDDGKMSYVLGSFVPGEADASAIVDYAALHAGNEAGVVPFKAWPEGIKGHFVARIPPLAGD